jgi:hypothetical protein
MVLLILAGLFIRGAQKAQEADLGFDCNNLQLASVDLAKQNYDQTHGTELVRRLTDEIAARDAVICCGFRSGKRQLDLMVLEPEAIDSKRHR